MDYGDFKITIYDFKAKTIKVKSDVYNIDVLCHFDNFSQFAKYIYGIYKKYDYVLKRGDKNGIKKNTY